MGFYPHLLIMSGGGELGPDERDFEYDTSDPPQFYDVFIEISHDFEDGEEIEC